MKNSSVFGGGVRHPRYAGLPGGTIAGERRFRRLRCLEVRCKNSRILDAHCGPLRLKGQHGVCCIANKTNRPLVPYVCAYTRQRPMCPFRIASQNCCKPGIILHIGWQVWRFAEAKSDGQLFAREQGDVDRSACGKWIDNSMKTVPPE